MSPTSALAVSSEDERFLYLIQEYEPFTFPMGSLRGAGERVLWLPHNALVLDRAAARLLPPPRDRGLCAGARDRRRGVRVVPERDHRDRSADRAPSWRPAIPARLLFYARPEAHASRNMFDLGVIALSRRAAGRQLRATVAAARNRHRRRRPRRRARRRRQARAAAALRPGCLRPRCCASTTWAWR